MAKITLGSRPKHFTRTVIVQLHEGGEGTIEVSFLYRTRKQYGAFVDELTAGAGVEPPKSQDAEDVKFSLESALSATLEKNAEYILLIADGWNLDQPFDLTHVRQMCDELPGAALSIMDQYRAAIVEGRLGN